MDMAVRKEYTEDLEKLKDEVQRMGELAGESAKNTINCLLYTSDAADE